MRSEVCQKFTLIMVLHLLTLPLVGTARAGTSDDDMAITSKVEEQLSNDFDLSGSRIIVNTDEGIVTLKGMVNSQLDKDQAFRLARSVDGVRMVNNDLKLESYPTHRNPSKFGAIRPAPCPIGVNWC
jgi:hypothetical protein